MNASPAGRTGLRVCLLSLLAVLPLCFWSAWEDCYPLAKWFALAGFGGAAVLLGAGALPVPGRGAAWAAWVPWWAAWAAASVFGAGVASRWRSVPEAVLLVLPPVLAAVVPAAGMPAAKLGAAAMAAGAATAGWALVQFAGLESGGWLSPFHKGVASTVGNPDLLGGALLVPFALAFSAWVREPRKFLAGAAVAVIGAGIACTEARAAWVSAAVAAVIGFRLGPGASGARAGRRAVIAAACAAVVVAGIVLTRPGASGRFASTGAARERVWTWALALDVALDRPVAGWGASSFRTVFLARQTAAHRAGATAYHYTEYAHLEPLHFAVELGLVGLGLALWGIVAAFRMWKSSPLRIRDPGTWAGAGAGAAAVLVDAALSWPLHVPPTVVPAWIMIGACAGAGAGFRRAPPLPLRFAAGAVLVALMVFGGRLGYVSGSLRLGHALAAAGRHDAAGAVWDRASRFRPGDVRLCWYAAASARARGANGAAGELVARGLVLEPDFTELHLEEAAVARATGDDNAAEDAYRAALLVDPGHAQAWNNLGNLLGRQGRLKEAEAAQRRAVELSPGMAEARSNLAITLIRLGKKEEARRVLAGGGG